MTKRELIDEITHLNPTATPGFLAGFEVPDLAEYLEHLKWTHPPAEAAGIRDDDEKQPLAAEDGAVRLAS